MDNLKIYLDKIKHFPLLSAEQEQRYVDQIRDYRNKLIEGNLRLVVKIAFEMYSAWNEVEVLDLIQEGNLALLDAVDRFEIDKNYKFSTFATHYIKGYMLTMIRNTFGPFKMGTTKSQREIFYNMGTINDLLLAEGADIDAIAGIYGSNAAELQMMTSNTVHLDDLNENDLVDCETPEDTYLKNEARLNLRRKIIEFRNTLTTKEKFLWDNRILDTKLTYNKCLKYLDLKYEPQVQRLEKKVIKKAKEFFLLQDFYDIIS